MTIRKIGMLAAIVAIPVAASMGDHKVISPSASMLSIIALVLVVAVLRFTGGGEE